MQRLIISIVLILQFCFLQLSSFAIEPISVELHKLSKTENKALLENKLYRKYRIYRLDLKNNTYKDLSFSKKKYFIAYNYNLQRTVLSDYVIYQKTKRHTFRRAVIWGVIGGGILSLISVPASITHSKAANEKLRDNIEKLNFKKRHLFAGEEIESYILINKKYDVDNITLKDVYFDENEKFDLDIPVINKEL